MTARRVFLASALAILCLAQLPKPGGTGAGGGSGTTYSAGQGIDATQLAAGTAAIDTSAVPLLSTANVFTNLGDWSSGSIRVQTGSGAPSGSLCSGAGNVGKLYLRSDAIATTALYRCQQTSSGVFGWVLDASGGATSAIVHESIVPICDSAGSTIPPEKTFFSNRSLQQCIATGVFGQESQYKIVVSGTDWWGVKTTFPSGTVTDVTVRTVMMPGATDSLSQTVTVQSFCQAEGTAYNSGSFTGGVTSAANTSHTNANIEFYTTAAISTSGCSGGTPFYLKIDPSTIAHDLYMLAIEIEYTRTLP